MTDNKTGGQSGSTSYDEHYAFVLGTLARLERKLDYILEALRADDMTDEEEEFDMIDDSDLEEIADGASSSREPESPTNTPA